MRRHVQDITQNHPKTDDGNIRSRKLGRPDTVSDKERRPRGDGGAVCAAYVYAVRAHKPVLHGRHAGFGGIRAYADS